MKLYITALFLFVITLTQAQRSTYQVAIGNITDNSARVIVIADTLRMVSIWRGNVYSDHHGDKEIFNGYKIIRRNNTYVFEFRKLKPNTMYSMAIVYMDTFARDTFYTSKEPQQGQLKWWKGASITYAGKKYSGKYFKQLMLAPAEIPVVERKEEEEHED